MTSENQAMSGAVRSPAGWYDAPEAPGKRQYWSGWEWLGPPKPLRGKATLGPLPPQPSRRSGTVRQPRGELLLSVGGGVLGGHGLAFPVGSSVSLSFETEGFAVVSRSTAREFDYAEVEQLRVGGPGAVKSGGGFVGGGFGLDGAVSGMAIAGLLNAITTRTTVTTIVQLITTDAELYLHNSHISPDKLEMSLSPVMGILRRINREKEAVPQALPPIAGPGAVMELKHLADMLAQDLITREEFDELKAGVLARYGS